MLPAMVWRYALSGLSLVLSYLAIKTLAEGPPRGGFLTYVLPIIVSVAVASLIGWIRSRREQNRRA